MKILSKNLLILASAGSGKTFQLANRVIALVASGAAPEKIVALTFTRKAAGEFADSVLTKLAGAAGDPASATALRVSLDLPDADFQESLERVVRALPGFTLGTIDGFFAKIVRGFQYELGLTGGKFDLLEGPRASALADEMLAEILGSTQAVADNDGFFHSFRRATIGKENHAVTTALRAFVTTWQALYQESGDLEWGPAEFAVTHPDEWEARKSGLAESIIHRLDGINYTSPKQRDALEKSIRKLESHVIGSGSLSKNPSLLDNILQAVPTQSGALIVKSIKDFTIGGPVADTLREMVELAAACELTAAVLRTRAVRDVVSVFDQVCATRLRSNGLLGFNDVKILMGRWATGEDARLRREAVDFRLDSRIDHWLLDEFQDTSRADWNGLLPLIDEAATDDESTVFIVGDRKQAIYAWRGGDVTLFDEIMGRYGTGLETAEMAESWRSCPEVLSLVNRVCGDQATLHRLFGDTASRWPWQDHVPAPPLTRTEKSGEARVEIVGTWEERKERLPEILRELGIGTRRMTCGILLRGNDKAAEVADHLRALGFDVIEEGRREPAKDSPVGIVIHHLLEWLANPANIFSREILHMSPLAPVLQAMHGPSWSQIWENLTDHVSKTGFAATVSRVIDPCRAQWSDFGRRRAGDLLDALASLDRQGGVSPGEAADWLERLEISQNPGVAAVQVMTIHKAKGLGFDVVILPEIPDDGLPQAQHFDVAKGDGWLTQTPPKWARLIIPEMREAESRWGSGQRYEAFCMLYVALTRAKRGLYVLLAPPSKSADPEKPSLSNWLIQSLGSGADNGVIYQNGSPDWPENVPLQSPDPVSETAPELGPAIPSRRRTRPTGSKRIETPVTFSHDGIRFGTALHAILEQIGWIDESPVTPPSSEAGRVVARLFRNPELAGVFQKQGRSIDLFREQQVDSLVDGSHMTGIVDRLHLHRDSNGEVTKVEIIDFKTDVVDHPDDLIVRYGGQMNAYRTVLEKIHPHAEICCVLLSVKHGKLVGVPQANC
ncbi:MAG: UvrD-helicase domain-containing protein [Verrucomicrobiota bacterium]